MAYHDAPSIAIWLMAGGLLLPARCARAALVEPAGAPPVIVVPRDWDEARQDEAVARLLLALERRRTGLFPLLLRVGALCAGRPPAA